MISFHGAKVRGHNMKGGEERGFVSDELKTIDVLTVEVYCGGMDADGLKCIGTEAPPCRLRIVER